MKKTSLKLIAAFVAALILLPNICASAQTNTPGSKLSNTESKQQQKTENMQLKQKVKAALTEKKDIIKNNHETNKALRAEIAQKKAEFKAIYKDIKQNHKNLTTGDLARINAQINIIKGEAGKLEATRGTIKIEFEQVKSAVKSGDVNDALSHLNKIISIQNTRTAALRKISSELDKLIDILKTISENTIPSTQITPPVETEPML